MVIPTAHLLKDKNILIISPEKWGSNMLSKHHYAIELGRNGNRVFFLNPPSTKIKEPVVGQTLYPNVFTVDYSPNFRGLNKLVHLAPWLTDAVTRFEIQKIKKKIQHQIHIVWSFDPFRFQNLKLFQGELAVFHSVDHFATQLDLLCARSADIIFAVSPVILEKYKGLKTPSFFINHGVSSVFLSDMIPVEKKKETILCGYVGNLVSFALHRENFLRIIGENHHVEFHLIGPSTSSSLGSFSDGTAFINQLTSFPNVTLHGELTPEKLATHIQSFDLFLVCYDSQKFGEVASNSHKILEYLSTGKVVVSSLIQTYKDLSPGLFEMARDDQELPMLFSQTVRNLSQLNSTELQRKRKEFARQNSYPEQIKRMEALIDRNVR